jgi:hypothetical protein
MGATEIKKVKVKLLRNPTVASSLNNEKSYTPLTGHTVEVYCKFRAMLDEYIKQSPLNYMNERMNAISLLLSGTPIRNWQNVLSQLPEDHIWDEIFFKRPYALLHLFIVVPWLARSRKDL